MAEQLGEPRKYGEPGADYLGYYTELGLGDRVPYSEVPQADIKKAYRALARELHQDVNPDPETAERFKAISTAYECLGDENGRGQYDRGEFPDPKESARLVQAAAERWAQVSQAWRAQLTPLYGGDERLVDEAITRASQTPSPLPGQPDNQAAMQQDNFQWELQFAQAFAAYGNPAAGEDALMRMLGRRTLPQQEMQFAQVFAAYGNPEAGGAAINRILGGRTTLQQEQGIAEVAGKYMRTGGGREATECAAQAVGRLTSPAGLHNLDAHLPFENRVADVFAAYNDPGRGSRAMHRLFVRVPTTTVDQEAAIVPVVNLYPNDRAMADRAVERMLNPMQPSNPGWELQFAQAFTAHTDPDLAQEAATRMLGRQTYPLHEQGIAQVVNKYLQAGGEGPEGRIALAQAVGRMTSSAGVNNSGMAIAMENGAADIFGIYATNANPNMGMQALQRIFDRTPPSTLQREGEAAASFCLYGPDETVQAHAAIERVVDPVRASTYAHETAVAGVFHGYKTATGSDELANWALWRMFERAPATTITVEQGALEVFNAYGQGGRTYGLEAINRATRVVNPTTVGNEADVAVIYNTYRDPLQAAQALSRMKSALAEEPVVNSILHSRAPRNPLEQMAVIPASSLEDVIKAEAAMARTQAANIPRQQIAEDDFQARLGKVLELATIGGFIGRDDDITPPEGVTGNRWAKWDVTANQASLPVSNKDVGYMIAANLQNLGVDATVTSSELGTLTYLVIPSGNFDAALDALQGRSAGGPSSPANVEANTGRESVGAHGAVSRPGTAPKGRT